MESDYETVEGVLEAALKFAAEGKWFPCASQLKVAMNLANYYGDCAEEATTDEAAKT